jgi:hypothetical protein
VATVAFAPERLRALFLRYGIPGAEPDMAAIRDTALKWFSHRDRILRIRVDCLLSLAVVVLSTLQYGTRWPVLLLAVYGRALIYSTLDNLPHYGTRQRGSRSARALSLPDWASFILLNQPRSSRASVHPLAGAEHLFGGNPEGSCRVEAVPRTDALRALPISERERHRVLRQSRFIGSKLRSTKRRDQAKGTQILERDSRKMEQPLPRSR